VLFSAKLNGYASKRSRATLEGVLRPADMGTPEYIVNTRRDLFASGAAAPWMDMETERLATWAPIDRNLYTNRPHGACFCGSRLKVGRMAVSPLRRKIRAAQGAVLDVLRAFFHTVGACF